MQKAAHVFMPPNTLKEKIDAAGGLNEEALKRAEAALEELKSEFEGWMSIDISHLFDARGNFEKNRNPATRGALYRAAHDLKGQGTLFEYPLVTRIAASLCKLLDVPGGAEEVPILLVDAHLGAIKAVTQQKIKDAANPMALVLSGELERKVKEFQSKSA